MVAHVAYEVGSDAPLYETPLSVVPLEAVVVATTDGVSTITLSRSILSMASPAIVL